ncbi:MAG: hypothetical protein DSZ21_00290 [Tenericutes bacterium]|nr:MAG: hypothetical protein DSZ21_00290 [Mycoplasmatota bacterium]
MNTTTMISDIQEISLDEINVEPKLLKIQDLSVQFKKGYGRYFNAINGVSFDVEKGEIIAIVGESDSGKSMIANSLLGLIPHSTGFIKINEEIIPNKPRNIKRKSAK